MEWLKLFRYRMKKLLLILLCLPMIGFGQNVNQIELFDKNQKKYTVVPSYNLLSNFCLETKKNIFE